MVVTALVARRVGRVSVVDVTWGLGLTVVVRGLRDPHTGVAAVAAGRAGRGLGAAALVAHLASLARPRRGPALRGAARPSPDAALAWFAAAVRKVFLIQGAALWFVSWPVQAAAVAVGGMAWPWSGSGWPSGPSASSFETVGDAQLAAYKQDPDRGPVMDRGLWAWTRHPNYFGDACVWWGIWLAGAASTGWLPALLTLPAPIAMTYFLAYATGAKLLERTMMQRPGYPEYAARTSMFFPLPPRR